MLLRILAFLGLLSLAPAAAGQYYITELEYGDGQWGLVMSDQVSYTRQYWVTSKLFPEKAIQSYWDRNYHITHLAWSGSVWVVVMSQGSGIAQQSYTTADEFPARKIEQYAREGYAISSLIFAAGQWVVIASRGQQAGEQEIWSGSDFPSKQIQEAWRKGLIVTELTYGSGIWGLVLSKARRSTAQRWMHTQAFPKAEIDELWAQGYYISSLAYGDGRWAVVLNEDGMRRSQMWNTSPQFPREQIDLYWNQRDPAAPVAVQHPVRPPVQQPVQQPRPQPAPAAGAPKVWAVLVGISDYSEDINNIGTEDLRFAHSDAIRMYEFLRSPEGGSLPASQIALVTNDRATKASILDACSRLYAQASPRDLIIFYFSGHGSPYSFLAYDGSLFHAQLKTVINSSQARLKLCVADACHSGSWDKSANYTMKSTSQEVMQRYYDALDKAGDGIALFMSSAPQETSLECGRCEMGLFTYYYIEGLKGLADADGNRVVTIQELFAYVRKKVSFFAETQNPPRSQTPQLSGSFDGDLPVSVLR
ncbi:MAG: caspase family protein [Bacteroidia bacterium]|nr:caspase family protein [Bacteroidia bacterium]